MSRTYSRRDACTWCLCARPIRARASPASTSPRQRGRRSGVVVVVTGDDVTGRAGRALDPAAVCEASPPFPPLARGTRGDVSAPRSWPIVAESAAAGAGRRRPGRRSTMSRSRQCLTSEAAMARRRAAECIPSSTTICCYTLTRTGGDVETAFRRSRQGTSRCASTIRVWRLSRSSRAAWSPSPAAQPIAATDRLGLDRRRRTACRLDLRASWPASRLRCG